MGNIIFSLWRWLTTTGRGEEFVDLRVAPGVLVNVLRRSGSPSCLDICTRRGSLYQCHLLRLRQVLYLDGQQRELSDGHKALFLFILTNVLVSLSIRISSDVVKASYLVTLLYVFHGEQLVVAVAHVPHAKVYTRAVDGGTNHQGHHGFRNIYALRPRQRFTLTSSISISALISVSTFRCLSQDGRVLSSCKSFTISRRFCVHP
jgi:hypothetical protein